MYSEIFIAFCVIFEARNNPPRRIIIVKIFIDSEEDSTPRVSDNLLKDSVENSDALFPIWSKISL